MPSSGLEENNVKGAFYPGVPLAPLYSNNFPTHQSGPCRDLWRGRCSKYKRGTWNTAFNRAVLLADMCIEMDASVLIQQQMP